MNVQQLLTRVRTMSSRRTIDGPGAGGCDPAAPLPAQTVRPAWVRAGLDVARKLALEPFADAADIDLNDLDRESCASSGFGCWALGLPLGDAPGSGGCG